MLKITLLYLIGLSLLGFSCTRNSIQSNTKNHSNFDSTKGLKDYYSDYFRMGVAVSPRALKTDEGNLVTKHFSSMTAENVMKMGPIHPLENQYNWADADSIFAFANRNNIKMRGHTLCWHSQTPKWFFTDSITGKQVTKEVLLQRLKDHIFAVAGRYKGKVYAWDVVNEVISDKPDEVYRPSLFYQIAGEEFIEKAFQFAHEADPKALLFYNDYNEISDIKRAKIIKMVKEMREKGVPIQGIGLQAHWAVNEPTKEKLEQTLADFSTLNLPIHITELDISVYPKEHNSRDRKAEDYDTQFTPEKKKKQEEVYQYIFEIFRKYKKNITAITFWNISDRRSWLDNFPVRNRKDYPLLFDKDLKNKEAFWRVVKF